MGIRTITITVISAISGLGQGSPLTSASLIHESRLTVLNSAWAVNPSGLAMDFALEQISNPAQRYTSEESTGSQTNSSKATWMTLGVAKDVIWPLSVGFNFAAETASFSRKHGTWLQYSFLQKPKFPSLALRGKYSQTQFNNSARAGSSGLEMALSYGVGPMSVLANIELRGSKVTDLTKSDPKPQLIFSRHNTLGISIQPMFPTKIVLAKSISNGGRSSFISQIALEM